MTILIIGGVILGLVILANLALYILVLIRLFKKKGTLHGILGIIFSIYPFVWGWIKHRELKLTKIMLGWTLTSIIVPVLAIVMAIAVPGMMASRMSKPLPSVARQDRMHGKVVAGRPVKRVVSKKTVKAGPAAGKAVLGPRAAAADAELRKLDQLIREDGNNAAAYYNRAGVLASKGEIQKALNDYIRCVSIRPDKDAYYNQGLVHVKIGHYAAALRDFNEAVRLGPRDADAYCNRGNVYYQMGKYDLALRDYNRAIEIRPGDGDVLYNRGVVYLVMGKKEKALEDFRKAARMGHPPARRKLKQLAAS